MAKEQSLPDKIYLAGDPEDVVKEQSLSNKINEDWQEDNFYWLYIKDVKEAVQKLKEELRDTKSRLIYSELTTTRARPSTLV